MQAGGTAASVRLHRTETWDSASNNELRQLCALRPCRDVGLKQGFKKCNGSAVQLKSWELKAHLNPKVSHPNIQTTPASVTLAFQLRSLPRSPVASMLSYCLGPNPIARLPTIKLQDTRPAKTRTGGCMICRIKFTQSRPCSLPLSDQSPRIEQMDHRLPNASSLLL